MAKAILYTRVSTDEQAESGLGLEAQEQAARQYAARVGIEVHGVSSDPGVSGSLGLLDRPGLMAAIDSLEKGDVLLVAKRDRIGRLEPLQMGIIEHEVQKRGARIVSAAGEGTENDNPDSVLLRGMIDLLARYERMLIGARTKAALAAKKARGEKVGRASYGWDWVGGQLVENEAEQKWVAAIVEMHERGLSFRKIADVLREHGVPKKSAGKVIAGKEVGSRWHDVEVRRIVQIAQREAKRSFV